MVEKIYALGKRYNSFYSGMRREECNEKQIKLFDKLDCIEKDGILSNEEIMRQREKRGNTLLKAAGGTLIAALASLGLPIEFEDIAPKLDAKHGGKIMAISYATAAILTIVALSALKQSSKIAKENAEIVANKP